MNGLAESLRSEVSNIAGKKILLVGGAGFIGHNLALTLRALGADVIILDGLQVNNYLAFTGAIGSDYPNRELYLHILDQRFQLLRQQGVPLYVQDCRDYHALQRWVTQVKPDCMVHLAAVSHANRSNKDPFSTFDHNFRTLENALDCAKENNVGHFIYFSSSMVYGNFLDDVVTEDARCEPLGIYGALKYGGEKLVVAYNQVFKLPYTIVRPSALYGERCVSRRVGQIFIENALTGLEIKITGDGESRLDFTYIEDFVQGMVKVIDNPASLNQTFNITYGRSQSLNEMVQIVKEHFPDVRVTNEPKDDLMPERGTLSVDKARRLLGYEPDYSLHDGFPKYIAWYKLLFENFQACTQGLKVIF